MANPEDKVRPFIQVYALAYPFHNSFFEMETSVSLYKKFSTHSLSFFVTV